MGLSPVCARDELHNIQFIQKSAQIRTAFAKRKQTKAEEKLKRKT